jgi:AcrR family transcriptional regulator
MLCITLAGAKGMTEAKSAREQTKERHRRALIEATADAIAEHGLAAVSISRILEKAGLSRGMVNLQQEQSIAGRCSTIF